MYSISAKVLLSLAALLVFLFSCSRESPEPLWEAQSVSGTDYEGGLLPVHITLKNPVDDTSHINWVYRKTAHLAYRKQGINSKNKITADTAFFYWDEPPPLLVIYDSTQIKKDTTVSWKIDTSYYYRDTILARVDNDQSLPIVIEVKNILPRIKSLTIGGVSKPPRDSLLTIAANLGVPLEITFNLEKPFKNPFNSSFHTEITMPPLMGSSKFIREKSSDSVFVYEWTMPSEEEISDSSGYLKIKDSGIPKERLYKVHIVAYTERGSVWVAAENELVKYSPTGTEVARISSDLGSISDISVNSNNGQLFVVDKTKNSFSIYNSYGKLLYKNDSLFQRPSGVAFGVVSDYIWIADAKNPLETVYEARLRRFLMTDSLRFASVGYEMSGPIKGLSVNQFQKDFVWFAIPESDTVGFTRERGLEPKFMTDSIKWNRPSMISHDPSNGMAWVADSSRIVAIDTNGHVLARISGFDFVSSVSASNGNVWASDNLRDFAGKKGRVYLFKGPFGAPQDTSFTVDNGRLIPGFINPISVSAYIADGGAWVIDKEAGRAVRLDSTGTIIASGTGLQQPILGKTLQSTEY